MRRYLRYFSASLLLVYVGDLLLKKFFRNGFYEQYALPETAAYLILFFAVGFFLLSIIEFEMDDE